jgi:Flp pilus assembly protein TadD
MIGVGKMINNVALKIAVSAVAIGSTMVACKPATGNYRPSSASAKAPKSEQNAAAAFAGAQAALRSGDQKEALAQIEQAVELSPRDVGYRTFLADLYMKQGRFQSAEQTFSDILELDPSNERAGLSVALARIALGRSAFAIAQLDSMNGNAPSADLGLAYALAGDPRRGVQLLESAARVPGASARVRQNLALAYALAGDWQKSRTTAAQDLSPADLGPRMEKWAAFTQPKASWDQVAGLLGVTPSEDPGQPARLALAAPQPEATAFAAAEPVAQPVPEPEPEPEPAPAPVAIEPPPVQQVAVEMPAESDWGLPSAAPEPQPQPEVTRPVYAEAIQSLVTPQPAVLRASAPAVEARARSYDRPVRAAAAAPRRASTGRFVVQLGAFGSAAGVERAWASAYKRYGFANHVPLSTTVKIAGRGTFHRLSVAGFESHGDASKVCRSVKAKGGACFVRAVAGDAPVRWASRYTGRRA